MTAAVAQLTLDRQIFVIKFVQHRPQPNHPQRITLIPFLQTLAQQRFDDHRYYHHSRVNQSLHLVSAVSFLASYALLFVNPALAAIVAWCISMTTRQTGHFFFEPREYDEVNKVSDEYKEEIKVGYNIRRKIVLLAVWLFLPILVAVQPSLFGLIAPFDSISGYAHDVGIAWLILGVAGLAFRGLQLTFQHGIMVAIAWMTTLCTETKRLGAIAGSKLFRSEPGG